MVKIYDLAKQELTQRLQAGVKWISSIDIHPGGIYLALTFLPSPPGNSMPEDVAKLLHDPFASDYIPHTEITREGGDVWCCVAGDNLILGGYDKRVCWFDLDLSSKPYRVIRYTTCIDCMTG